MTFIKAEVNIHNLHVWTLTGNKVVGTVHIKLINESNQSVQIEKFNKVKFIYIRLNLLRAPLSRSKFNFKIQIVGPTRQIFHNYGIHYLTIQPEFSNALGIMLKIKFSNFVLL